ncbi:MAG: type II/IV secretion system protein [Candidatus Sungbacteria bacterium]|nr:type II/IV secretion system protein [Candidatus Sungbacteria bacterium]
MPIFEEEKQKKKIAGLWRQEEEETTKLLSEKYKVSYLNLAITPINTEALKIVPEEESRRAGLAVFQKIGKRLEIAVGGPDRSETVAALKKLANDGYAYTLHLVSKTSLEHAWGFFKQIAERGDAITGHIQISDARLEEFQKSLATLKDLQGLLHEIGTKRTTDTLELIIAGALKTDASDIHIEPQEEIARIRYRLDGVLHDAADIPTAVYKPLRSRIKLISELKLNITAKGQDGRFTIKSAGTETEVRTSTLPGPYGENIVMRILSPKAIAMKFEDLGMQSWAREQMERELKKPNGMILATGPTGSGKTTTLYGFLKKIHSPDIKIVTIEDPIEYHLTGIEQTQVEPEHGYDFASGLRSIIRQDPDVILVGEIRDLETAETAMHASLTGHLVFSTLHTNSAAGTIPRLLDIGVKPTIIAPAVNIAMAQRLLRRLCTACSVKGPATAEERKTIAAEFALFPPKIKKPDIRELELSRATGCQACNLTGYKGRTGVYEIILIDDAMEALIFKDPSEATIKKAAFEQGQITMRQDGILKIVAGVTDLAELERVVGGATM